jgi:four helix bundle protein
VTIQGYRDLQVWQKSVDLIEEVYALSRVFPREERYAFTTQIRKAAVSVSNNIAEGSGRGTTPDLLKFLSYSRGSVKETESMILVGERLQFVSPAQTVRVLGLTDEVSRMISGLRNSLSR